MQLRYLPVSSLRNLLKWDASKLFRLDKSRLAFGLFNAGMTLAVFTSFHISYFWSIESYYFILVSLLLGLSMVISNSLTLSIYPRRDMALAVLSCFVVLTYQNVTDGKAPFAYVASLLHLFIFFMLFRLDHAYLQRYATVLCKVTGCLMITSMCGFFMYLVGFPLPGGNVEYNDMYYYTNHYLFLLDDRSVIDIIPRFHSVFLEPGHMGTFLVLLLATQIGRWRKWYNMVMLFALFISFSLAAYGLLVVLIFLHLWMKRKRILVKVLGMVGFIALVVGGSFVYNDGDNMLNQLIVMRLEVNDKGDDIEGNNRVTPEFQAEFDSYMQSSDILFGREMDKTSFGNSGYKVYLYEYGFVGVFLLLAFYVLSIRGYLDGRTAMAMLMLAVVNFWIRAYPMMYAFYVPCYMMANLPRYKSTTDES